LAYQRSGVWNEDGIGRSPVHFSRKWSGNETTLQWPLDHIAKSFAPQARLADNVLLPFDIAQSTMQLCNPTLQRITSKGRDWMLVKAVYCCLHLRSLSVTIWKFLHDPVTAKKKPLWRSDRIVTTVAALSITFMGVTTLSIERARGKGRILYYLW